MGVMDLLFAKTNGETLEEHIRQCLKVMNTLKQRHPKLLSDSEWKLLEKAVIVHDLGKINELFQMKMQNGGKLPARLAADEISHGYLSPAMIKTNECGDKTEQIILVNAIFYHHDREEPNWEKIKSYIKEQLQVSWNHFREQNNFSIQASWGQVNFQGDFFREKLGTAFSNRVIDLQNAEKMNAARQLRYILIKGSLNRIDYCASAGRDSIEESTLSDEKSIAQCAEYYLTCKRGVALREMQRYLKDHAGENLIVTASTGSGKTEGALLWMEDQKGFYTLPLKVSINSIYERISQGNGIGYSPAVLLHSDAKGYYLTHDDDGGVQDRYETARLFAAPFTVTTIDQLFQFVYRVKGSEAAAAALATGRLVIDEIQMYSPDIIAIILYALKMTTEMGGSYLIMTATFPKVLYELFERKGIPYRIPEKSFHGDFTRRHRIRFYEDKEILDCREDILKKAQTRRVLVLCNTVRKATEVYEALQDAPCEVHLLHSRFLKKDRKRLEEAIERFAPNDPNRKERHGIWISTQIVEASLDIDFDVLFTELCSIDALLQRMGRVYRSRMYDLGMEPNVYIFDSKNTGNGHVINRDIYDFSKKAVQEFDGELLEESDVCDRKEQMMDKVYDPALNPEIKGDYWNEILGKWEILNHLAMYQYDRKDNQAKIRDIRSLTVIPKNVWNELQDQGKWQDWMRRREQLRPKKGERAEERKERNDELLRLRTEIMDYTVDIPHNKEVYGYEAVPSEVLRDFFPHDTVQLCDNDYQFDEKTLSGVGLMKTLLFHEI